jgi:hypothetical protein
VRCFQIDIRQTGAVGSHIGDQTFLAVADVNAFIETLGDGHRALGAEAELGAGLLLQRRGDERRLGAAAVLASRTELTVNAPWQASYAAWASAALFSWAFSPLILASDAH